MRLTPATVAAERDRLLDRAPRVVPLVNAVRDDLGDVFDADVRHVTADEYAGVVNDVFADGDRAVNVAGLAWILRTIDVEDDYPGFVVDELLGRELAGLVAGDQPLRLLAEATFHYADLRLTDADGKLDGDGGHGVDGPAGLDDLDAALAAGVQTVLPGWAWREGGSPFGVDGD